MAEFKAVSSTIRNKGAAGFAEIVRSAARDRLFGAGRDLSVRATKGLLDAIVETADMIADGRRSRRAAALSGWQFVGDDIYMVFRWDEQGGRPWLEALFKVNVTARDRKPTLVGRFAGLSQARKPLEDRLFLHDGQPSMIVTREGDWGLASWNLEAGEPRYEPLGTRLTHAMASPDGDVVYFVELTTYGMSVAGRIPLNGGERERYAEFRGNGTFVATAPPILCIEDERGVRYRLCASGQEQSFALGTSAVMTEKGLLVYSPKEAPQRAVLVSTEDLTPLARWSLN